jgi:hypothetical protein
MTLSELGREHSAESWKACFPVLGLLHVVQSRGYGNVAVNQACWKIRVPLVL